MSKLINRLYTILNQLEELPLDIDGVSCELSSDEMSNEAREVCCQLSNVYMRHPSELEQAIKALEKSLE